MCWTQEESNSTNSSSSSSYKSSNNSDDLSKLWDDLSGWQKVGTVAVGIAAIFAWFSNLW